MVSPSELDQLIENLIQVYESNFISEYEYKIRYVEGGKEEKAEDGGGRTREKRSKV